MGSQRLPGKVLADLGGKSMLARVVERLIDTKLVDLVMVATTSQPADDAIVAHARQLGIMSFRGDTDDVLGRYLGAARASRAEVIVRVTADCPLLDPGVVDRVVGVLARDVDYASNTQIRTYPRGLDVEALHRDTLERIGRLATTPATREHVTSFVTEHPNDFRIAKVIAEKDDSDLRWTVDTPEDLALVRTLNGAGVWRDYRELVAFVRGRRDLAMSNAHVVQKHWTTHA